MLVCFSLTCRQLVASIFCRQYRELFCQDMGIGVSALIFLDTVPLPEFLILGFVYRLAEEIYDYEKGGLS